MAIRRRLRSLLWRVPVEQEVREELAHHLDLRTEELIGRGLEPAKARAEAMRRLGDPARIEAELAALGLQRNREWNRRDWFDGLRQDVVFALRQAWRQPAFTLAAVITLALGIGAATAIFSVVHSVVLRPFPYPNPDRVLYAYTTWRDALGNTSVGNFDYLRTHVTTLEQFAAGTYDSFNLADDQQPERVLGGPVTYNYFAVFGIPPLLGRTIAADEDQPGRAGVVVLSHRLWQRRFGGDPSAVGRTMRMNGVTYSVIGVMPASFEEVEPTAELWVPIAFTTERLAMHDEHYLDLYARRLASASPAQVNADLMQAAHGLARDFPEDNRERGAGARLFGDQMVGDYRTRLFVLLAAVGLVLLIACGNVANLLLARLAARSRELAVRAAIGAGRARIVRQVMTESLVLSALGGLLGILVAKWAVPPLVAMAPTGVPRLASAHIDGTVLGMAMALVIASALCVGVLPAWHVTRRGALRDDLGDGKGTASGGMKPWMRQTLIATQSALVLVVLSGAGLLVRSAIKLQQVPLGLNTAGVLSARIALPAVQYPTPDASRAAFSQMLDGLKGAPGVSVAALDSQPPLLSGGGSNGLVPEGLTHTDDRIQSESHFVAGDYFETLGIPLKAGRRFSDDDVRSAQLVMIVNQTLARRAFGDADPIGKRMACCEGGPDAPSWKMVIGVVGDVRSRGPAEPPQPEFYLPLMQIPDEAWGWIGRTLAVVARGKRGADGATTAADSGAIASAIRQAVRAVDPSLPVFAIRTIDQGLDQRMAQARCNTWLMSLLALTGLALAALGIYSVIAWLVAQRTREIGVRMALGATARHVLWAMTTQGLLPVVIGLAVGLVAALATTRLLQGQLFEVGPRDPLTLGGVALLLLIVSLVATLLPAWRATAITPARALHDA